MRTRNDEGKRLYVSWAWSRSITRIIHLLFVPAGIAIILTLVSASGTHATVEQGTAQQETPSDFIRAKGHALTRRGEPVFLRAVNFSNFYFMNLTAKDLLSSPHHSEVDFKHVKRTGFNSVRFAFAGKWYEQFADAFWLWLDQNIAWAKQHGIYLILDLHTPIGSFWLDPTKGDVNFDLWTNRELQRKNLELWRAIARRYRDEPQIAAYDLLNEPVTLDKDGSQWRSFAKELVEVVRSEDPNHLIIAGALYGTEGRYGTESLEKHFLLDDDNVMYDFHFYEPIKYTHQSATWLERPIGEGGSYPDPQVLLPTGSQVLLPAARISTAPLEKGDTGWAEYDSGPVLLTERGAVAGLPILAVRGAFRGSVHFDAMRVLEYDAAGTYIREVLNDALGAEDAAHWYHWQQRSDEDVTFKKDEGSGFNDRASLAILGRGQNSVSGWSNHDNLFAVKPGYRYRIIGHMRGEGVEFAPGKEATGAVLEIDFYGNPHGSEEKSFLARDKALLKHKMERSLAFGASNNVPMSVMEFGLVNRNFEDDRGGERWISDLIDLLKEHVSGFAYWEYHGDKMGIFPRELGSIEYATPPLKENKNISDAFARKFRN